MPAPLHIQAATLDRYIEGWKHFTAESWMATWSHDCQQKMLPFTLGIPSRSRAEVEIFLPKLMSVLKNYKVDFHEIVHDAAKSKAVIYATSYADTIFEGFKWTNEYAVFLTFTEDGENVSKTEEMVDTAFFREFFPKLQKYLIEQDVSK